MDHDLGVGQGVALAARAGRENDRGAAGGDAHAVRRNRTFHVLHGVVDGQRRGHRAAGAVDVKMDFLSPVLVLQEQQLLDGDVGQVVGDRRVTAGLRGAAEENDTVFQEQVRQGHLPLPGVVAVALVQGVDRQPGVQVEHGGFPCFKSPRVATRGPGDLLSPLFGRR